jgi:hypothetical protein
MLDSIALLAATERTTRLSRSALPDAPGIDPSPARAGSRARRRPTPLGRWRLRPRRS